MYEYECITGSPGFFTLQADDEWHQGNGAGVRHYVWSN